MNSIAWHGSGLYKHLVESVVLHILLSTLVAEAKMFCITAECVCTGVQSSDYSHLYSWFTQLFDKSAGAIKEAFNGKDLNGFLVNKIPLYI